MVSSVVSILLWSTIGQVLTAFRQYTGNDTYRQLAEGSVRQIISVVRYIYAFLYAKADNLAL